jgi:beta-galactosidase
MSIWNQKTCVLTMWILLSCGVMAWQPPENNRIRYNFNPGWKLFVGDPNNAEKYDFIDTQWKEITLPHAFNEDDAFKKGNLDLTTGIVWYRKHFNIPTEQAGKKIFLEFEGIRQGGEFYLNGQRIGLHENGVMAFGFDITDRVKPAPQENVLAVRIDNSWDYREKATNSKFQWNDRNFNANYGGIPKNIWLHITDKLYQTLPLYSFLGTTGVYIYTQDFDIAGKTAKITAETQVENEYPAAKTIQYEVIIEDLDGKVIKTMDGGKTTIAAGEIKIIKVQDVVKNLNFWSWGYGYLYNVYTILKMDGKAIDIVKTRTGFRKTEFANGMVKLNDRVIQIKGYAQRTTNEWPAVGLSVPPWLSDFSNRLMIESNGNTVRWMHITPWKQDVESCDRVGLIQAMPAGDSEKDVEGRRWEQRVEVMRDAIIYNRNNPSILFYEGGNKGISEDHQKQLNALRDQYDPQGGRAAGSREMLDSKVAEYGGEMLYINKSARIPMWATEYSRDEGLRKYWDEYSPPFHKDGDGPRRGTTPPEPYNRNQDSHAIENVRRWFDYWEQRPGTGNRVSSGGVSIVFSDTNTHARGEENYRRSGEVDSMRLPKDAFYAHQVMWDGWVDVEKPGIYIIGHWNYEPTIRKNVYIVSSADKVELFVNGKSLGFGKQDYRFLFTFENIQWQAGTIKAVGYDAAGKKLCETDKKTAGKPDSIRLAVSTGPKGLRADGADMALVQVEVVDAEGNRCPTALNTIDFDLQGPAEWRGGIAQGPDNCILSKQLPVECGVNRVLIRSAVQPGKIVLSAKSEGLKSASVEILSKSFEVKDGLSLTMPDEGLVCRLDRGPTPKGESFKVTRIPVSITGVIAGANADKAAASYDDNETTNWANDGKLATGWIQYEFGKPADVNQVVLKLSSWRNKRYPLRITIDGKEVWKGDTEQTLGYYTIRFEPTKGKTLKIELTGAGQSKDGFDIVEVTGQKDQSAAAKDSKGTLSIVEAEIYEPAAMAGK